MEFILLWVALSFLVMHYASKKGQSAIGSLFVSLLLSPLIGAILTLISNDNSENIKFKNQQIKKCPACAEIIKFEAIKCKHCGVSILDNIPVLNNPANTLHDKI